MFSASRLSRFGLAALIALVSLPVAAQWAWREDNGRVVYSDRPPPAAVKSSQIIRRPGGQSASAPITSDTQPATEGKADAKETGKEASKEAGKEASAGPKTYAEKEMEFRKRQQERAEAEKKQQEQQARATQKAQQCERQRGYLRALEDGVRVSRTDAQGNREMLDDAQRAAETKRTREAIAEACS